MRSKEVLVESREEGGMAPAAVLICEECGHDEWAAYFVAHNPGEPRHLHLQCANCGDCQCQPLFTEPK